MSEDREGGTRRLPDPQLTNAAYLSWQNNATTISSIGAWNPEIVTLSGLGAATRIRSARVTSSLFDVLATQAFIGRTLQPRDEVAGAAKVAVISYGLWQRAFGGGADVLERFIDLGETRYNVVGVMPKTFGFPHQDTDVWVTLRVESTTSASDPGVRVQLFRAIARLSPDTTAEQAAAEGRARAQVAAPELGPIGVAIFGSDGRVTLSTTPYRTSVVGDLRLPLTLIVCGVALLLTASVSSLATVQATRFTLRHRDVALRVALGADTTRLLRPLIVEAVLPILLGSALGLGMSGWLHKWLPILLPADFPRLGDVRLDLPVTLTSLGASLLAAASMMWFPVRQARRLNVVKALVENGQTSGVDLRLALGRGRAVVLGSQVAAAALLLFLAIVLGRSFMALVTFDRGYNPSGVLTARLSMPDSRFTEADRAAVLNRVLQQLTLEPAITAAAATSVLPLTTAESLLGFDFPAPEDPGRVIRAQVAVRHVTPGYSQAMGMRIVEGRWHQDSDRSTDPAFAVVNRAFADAYLGEHRVGLTLKGWQIIGVSENVRQRSADDRPTPEVYLNLRQMEGLRASDPYIVARVGGDPMSIVPALQAAIATERGPLAWDSVMPMDRRLMATLSGPRFYATVVGCFACLALTIVGIGLFGAFAFSVASRRKELGIRGALGATPAQIVALTVGQGLAVVAAGLTIGLAAAAWVGRLLNAVVFNVDVTSPSLFASVATVVIIIAAVALYVPARRAARVTPLVALKLP